MTLVKYMIVVYRGATISLVGRHNTAIVLTKRPLPAKYSTALLPLVLLNSCAAISGPQIPPITLPKNEAKPVAVPRTAEGNASGVHPKSYNDVFQRASSGMKTKVAYCCVEKALTEVLQHVEADMARLCVYDTIKKERDTHDHRRENERPFSPDYRCTDHEDAQYDSSNPGGVDDQVVHVCLF